MIAFIFADLIVVPILDIYRRYYTARIAWFLTWTLFVAMALAGLAVEVLFKALNAVPQDRNALVPEAHVALNYTTVLNVLFLALAAVLTWRAARTGGFQMVRIMNAPAPAHNHR